MSTTRKKMIVERYTALMEDVREHLPAGAEGILPSLDDYDVADLAYYFSFIFPGGCDIDSVVRKQICSCVECTEKQFDILIPKIREFVVWFQKLI
jgi:hypothetical protein